MFRASVLATAVLLAGCSSGVSGEYGGDECLYDKLSFGGDGVVYITFMGMEQAGQYKIDGERVVVTAGTGQSIVFTRNGKNLEASLLGEKMICSEL